MILATVFTIFLAVSITFRSSFEAAADPQNALLEAPAWLVQVRIMHGNELQHYCTGVLVERNILLFPNYVCMTALTLDGNTGVAIVGGSEYDIGTEYWTVGDHIVLHKIAQVPARQATIARIYEDVTVPKKGYVAYYERTGSLVIKQTTALTEALLGSSTSSSEKEFCREPEASSDAVYYSYDRDNVATIHGTGKAPKETCLCRFRPCYANLHYYKPHIYTGIQTLNRT